MLKLKKINILLSNLLLLSIVILAIQVPTAIFAQQHEYKQQNSTIPSDLSLDLAHAEQNPAPEQKQIIENETIKTEITEQTGQITVVTPQDIVPDEIKTESSQNAVHPEQTTSEQVIETPVTVIVTSAPNETNPPMEQTQEPTGEGNTVNSTGTDTNLIPGTSITEPDDNAAPTTAPSLVPTSTDQNTQDITQPPVQQNNNEGNAPTAQPATDNGEGAPQDQATISQPVQQQSQSTDTIPLENGDTTNNPQDTTPNNSAAQPQDQSPQNPDTNSQQPQTQPAQDSNSGGSSTDQYSQPSSDNTENSTAVQGAATGPAQQIPWWLKIFFKILGFK